MEIFQNPFITSTEVFTDEDFYDREEIMIEVEKFYNREQDYNFLIFGQRRIGKTSLLKKIEKKYNNSMSSSIYITLQGEAETELDNLLEKIAKKIANRIGIKFDYDVNSENFTSKFLVDVKQVLNGNKLILLFDEFDVLGDLESVSHFKKTFSFHRFIPYTVEIIENIKQFDIPLKIIFAIGRNYKDLDNERFGQITRFGQQVELGFFPYRVVVQLLSVTDNILPFTDLAKQKIFDITGGHPYFTQCLAHISYNEAIEMQKLSIDYFIVEGAVKKTIKRYSNGVIWIWDTLSAKDKIILYISAHLKELKLEINEQNIKDAAQTMSLLPACDNLSVTLSRLINIKFLTIKDNENLNFQVEFFRKWIINEITHDLVQKYFSKIDIQIDNILTNARFYYVEGNYSEAERLFNEIVKYRQEHYEALFYLAKSKILQGLNSIEEYSNVMDILDKVHKLNPVYKTKEINDFLSEFSVYCKEQNITTENIDLFIEKLDLNN